VGFEVVRELTFSCSRRQTIAFSPVFPGFSLFRVSQFWHREAETCAGFYVPFANGRVRPDYSDLKRRDDQTWSTAIWDTGRIPTPWPHSHTTSRFKSVSN